jgi:GT2 family glycosyltransferase
MTGAAPNQLPTVSFIVPTYRRPDVLQPTLRALLAVDYPPDRCEVIVVDDGSGDRTGSVVAELQKTTRSSLVYASQPNSGASTARNHGARLATGEILIFVDDDIVVEPSHVHDHLTTRTAHGDALVNGHWEFPTDFADVLAASPFGRFRLEVERWVKDRIPKTHLDDGCESPSAVTACNLGIRRELFWELGGFDETFPYAGYEDQEFSYRAVEAGCLLVYDQRIRLLHNDQRLTFAQFCQRQQRGAGTAVHLACRHPGEFSVRPLIIENCRTTRSDPPGLILKKTMKRGLSTGPALASIHAGIQLLERAAPYSRLLQRTYWFVSGLYIFKGVREGFAAIGVPTPGFTGSQASLCP